MYSARVVLVVLFSLHAKLCFLTAQLRVCVASISVDVAHGSGGNMCSVVRRCDSLYESDSGLVAAA